MVAVQLWRGLQQQGPTLLRHAPRKGMQSARSLQPHGEREKLQSTKCPVSNNDVFEGQVNQQKNYLKKRSELLTKMGLSTNVTAAVLATVATTDLREEDRISGERLESVEERLPFSDGQVRIGHAVPGPDD